MQNSNRPASLLQRLVSLLLTYAMLFTSLPVQAFAQPVLKTTPIVMDAAADEQESSPENLMGGGSLRREPCLR